MQRALHFGIKTSQLTANPEALLTIWRAADALPIFEHAWIFDHIMSLGDDPGVPCLESWTLLAALAVQTRRLRIGVMVSDNTYRHPGILAKVAATVDIMALGRLNFGLGTGWSETEHVAYGIPLPSAGERVRRLAEACELIRRLWTEPSVTFAGSYYQLNKAICEPKPVQKPFPPFAIGGEGEHTLRVIARYADIWDCSVSTPEEYRQKCAILERHCAAIGRDPASIAHSRHIGVDFTDLAATDRQTRSFIEAGANYIIYSLQLSSSPDSVRRLAEEVAEPIRAAYAQS
ncbi:TIGR03560 family F420-dependent LLM class oxidoreductase [Ktedonosporobacter rubrisoli]|uniref:TIGR03560 family F420-dependent LLM class oxidoreductase n=1 Tax=Ktedonosporobacter rubrisoli TaxID=2509675 RepID=A0A4P6JL87_KTERU|nr:TIGR03560 family F420-dependent LLM class oxidoreductase [Ktedonosporobacter rubrisoli]QBD75944.1 TIGR03560 family F420-dependent LLM class oxidoreductase [Ktedonosporobacter rubrisoli]